MISHDTLNLTACIRKGCMPGYQSTRCTSGLLWQEFIQIIFVLVGWFGPLFCLLFHLLVGLGFGADNTLEFSRRTISIERLVCEFRFILPARRQTMYIYWTMRWLLATSRRELETKNALHLLSRYMTKLVVEDWEVMWVRLAVGTSNQTKFVVELTLFIKTDVLAMLEVFAYETSKRFALKEKGTL